MLEIQKDTGMSLDAVQDQIRAVARRIEGYKIQHRELVRHAIRRLLHGISEKLALCDAIRKARFEMLSLLARSSALFITNRIQREHGMNRACRASFRPVRAFSCITMDLTNTINRATICPVTRVISPGSCQLEFQFVDRSTMIRCSSSTRRSRD